MLEICQLCAGYGGRRVLESVSFCAQQGQVTAIIGPNGCGKSTLLKAACGILPVQGGQVLLNGESLLALPRQQLAQRALYLPQNRQPPDLTAGRLVLHGRFPYLGYPRRYRPEDQRAADEAMAKLQIAHLAQVPMSHLSGGQQQRVYIAAALAQNTDVVLLDEPTTYLDVACQLQVLQLVRALADNGRHVLMVLHDLTHAMEAADRVILMAGGSLLAAGTPDKVYSSGLLEKAFGVAVARVEVGGGFRYFCTGSL